MSEKDRTTFVGKTTVKTRLAALCQNYPEIVRIELFGSLARGESTALSDIDLVVSFVPTWKRNVNVLDYFSYMDGLKNDLTKTLGKQVHLTDYAGVESSVRIGNTALAKAIARDGQLVYEAEHSTEGCAGSHHGELPQGGRTHH